MITAAVSVRSPCDLKRNRFPQPFDGLLKDSVYSRNIRCRGLPGYNRDAGYYRIEYYRTIGLVGIIEPGRELDHQARGRRTHLD